MNTMKKSAEERLREEENKRILLPSNRTWHSQLANWTHLWFTRQRLCRTLTVKMWSTSDSLAVRNAASLSAGWGRPWQEVRIQCEVYSILLLLLYLRKVLRNIHLMVGFSLSEGDGMFWLLYSGIVYMYSYDRDDKRCICQLPPTWFYSWPFCCETLQM